MTTFAQVHLAAQRLQLRFLALEAGHDPSPFGRGKETDSPVRLISTSTCRRCGATFTVEVSLDGADGGFSYPTNPCPGPQR